MWQRIGITDDLSTCMTLLPSPVGSEPRSVYHAARAVHGTIYFRALDEAAFFAANSRVPDVLVLTVSFLVHFTAPVSEGELLALGRVVHESGRLLVAESELMDNAGRLLAKGSGTFIRSRILLTADIGYA